MGKFFPSSTWHSVHISIMLLVSLGKKGFLSLRGKQFKPLGGKVFQKNLLWEDPEGSGREGGGRGDRHGEYM